MAADAGDRKVERTYIIPAASFKMFIFDIGLNSVAYLRGETLDCRRK